MRRGTVRRIVADGWASRSADLVKRNFTAPPDQRWVTDITYLGELVRPWDAPAPKGGSVAVADSLGSRR